MTLSLVSYLSTSWAPCVRRRASEHTAQHLHTVAVGSSVRTVRDVQSQLFHGPACSSVVCGDQSSERTRFRSVFRIKA